MKADRNGLLCGAEEVIVDGVVNARISHTVRFVLVNLYYPQMVFLALHKCQAEPNDKRHPVSAKLSQLKGVILAVPN